MRNLSDRSSFRWPRKFSGPLLMGAGGLCVCLLAPAPPCSAPRTKPVVPTVNAELGACSANFVVRDGNRKPLYGAKIEVTFRYGFLGLHKLSLRDYTNSDGKAHFAGLPGEVKHPLVFRIEYGPRQKTVTDDPGVTCYATEKIALP